ncbi:MAG: nuclear transport factor 2 family protein [Chthoniobacterales bacterium]|nr:nuclear transport factor 2 family protein [Chthoniobacterales bacterium]
MKKLLNYITVALVATVAIAVAAPDKDQMLAKETAAWQAFKDKKADDFKKVVGEDMIGVYADGIADMAKEMADMQKWDMKSFKISDYKTHSDGKDVVVSCYTITLEGTFDGADASGTYNSGSVWKQENGKWHAIFHTNVKQASAGTAPDAQKKE